jgi:hypothetical protein
MRIQPLSRISLPMTGSSHAMSNARRAHLAITAWASHRGPPRQSPQNWGSNSVGANAGHKSTGDPLIRPLLSAKQTRIRKSGPFDSYATVDASHLGDEHRDEYRPGNLADRDRLSPCSRTHRWRGRWLERGRRATIRDFGAGVRRPEGPAP